MSSPRKNKKPRKPKPRPKAKPAPAPELIEHPAVDLVIMLMINGLSRADLEAACINSLKVPTELVGAVIATATRKITIAAHFNRDEQTGTAIKRLNDLYTRAHRNQDYKTSLATQRELNKLLALYQPPALITGLPGQPGTTQPTPGSASGKNSDGSDTATPPSPEAAELDAIARHLEPLNLAPEGYPLREIARIAADLIRLTQSPAPTPATQPQG